MQAHESPLVVLVHGAWHGAWCWATLQTELDMRGVPSLALDLPGHGASIEPLGDLDADAAALSALLATFTRPIVLVGHSYGGAVVSAAEAVNANVFHLVYLAAYVPDVGESIISMSKAFPAAATDIGKAMINGGGTSTIDPELAHAALYNRCDPMVTRANVARLSPQPFVTFTQPARRANWRTIPSTYVRCTDDHTVPPVHQDAMAGRCTHTENLDTDHSPFSSMPVQTAEIIARIARR